MIWSSLPATSLDAAGNVTLSILRTTVSKTKKGKKSPGFDYWGKRALSGNCGFGPEVKKLTHKKERAQAKQDLHKKKKEKDEE
jgi:hypothetical protein